MRMKRFFFLAVLAASCAPAAQQRTIEPTAPGGAGGTGGGKEDTNAFTLSRKPKPEDKILPSEYPIHLAEKWFPFRAEYLTIGNPEAINRDSGLPEGEAPEKFWDEQTAIEAVSIW